MNRNLLIALTLPSLMFYQSNAPILYSSEKLIAQVKEEQAILGFDLSESGNHLQSCQMIKLANENLSGCWQICPEQSCTVPK